MKKLNTFTPPPRKTQYIAFRNITWHRFKKIVCAISLFLCFVLTACTSSNAEDDLSSQPEQTADSAHIPQSASEGVQEEQLSSSVQERILSICPEASIYEDDDSLSVDMTEAYQGFSADLIYTCAHIIGTSDFSEEYPGISFSYLTDDLTFFLSVSDFQNIANYTTTLICTGDDSNQVAAAQILYDKLFYNHDVGNKQLIEQGKIAEKYGVDGGDATAELKPEDELWFYSFFDSSVLHSYENGIFAINYRVETDDFYKYGYDVWSEFYNAISSFSTYFSESEDLITLNQIVLICFDGQSDTRLFECTNDKLENNTFQINGVNYLNDDFKNGLLSKYNEN